MTTAIQSVELPQITPRCMMIPTDFKSQPNQLIPDCHMILAPLALCFRPTGQWLGNMPSLHWDHLKPLKFFCLFYYQSLRLDLFPFLFFISLIFQFFIILLIFILPKPEQFSF